MRRKPSEALIATGVQDENIIIRMEERAAVDEIKIVFKN
jgi:hypothetical protein